MRGLDEMVGQDERLLEVSFVDVVMGAATAGQVVER